MPYPTEHAARLESPDYDEYRRTSGGTIYGSKTVPENIDIIWGHNKSEPEDAWHAQALRFPVKNWTADEAKKWLKDNNIDYISFEAASEQAKARLSIEGIIAEYTLEDHLLKEYFGFEEKRFSNDDLKSFLALNQDATEIELLIDSPGGSVEEGFAIHDHLAASGKKITTIGGARVHSIATVIFMSASPENRFMSKNTSMIIHSPTMNICGGFSTPELESITGISKHYEDKILNFYADKTKADTETLKDLMRCETALDASQAKELGFVGNILDLNTVYNKVFKAVAFSNKSIRINDNQKTNLMKEFLLNKLPAIAAFLGLKPEDKITIDAEKLEKIEAEVVNLNGKITALTAEKEQAAADLQASSEKVAALEAEKAALETAKAAAETKATDLADIQAKLTALETEVSTFKSTYKPENRVQQQPAGEKTFEERQAELRKFEEEKKKGK